MAKTPKQYLSEVWAEMNNICNQANNDIKQVKESELSEYSKQKKIQEITKNREKDLCEIMNRPWYEEAREVRLKEIKARIDLADAQEKYDKLLAQLAEAKNQLEIKKKQYESAKDAYRGEIPPKLKAFRKKWEEEIPLPEDKKKAIIEAVNRIQEDVKEESDWSILVTFKLWWKIYHSLNVNLKEHSDEGYTTPNDYNWEIKNEVKLRWMMWDDTSNWENKKLATYIEDQKNDENRRLKIPTRELLEKFIDELWKETGLEKDWKDWKKRKKRKKRKEKKERKEWILMGMYLTWNYWMYALIWDKSRSFVNYNNNNPDFYENNIYLFSTNLSLTDYR